MISWLVNNPELCNAITSIATVVISVIAILISIATYQMQNKFNKNSVKPLFRFEFEDLPNRIAVKIRNYGLGVGIIKDAIFTSANTGGAWETLLEAIEEIGMSSGICKDRGIWKSYE